MCMPVCTLSTCTCIAGPRHDTNHPALCDDSAMVTDEWPWIGTPPSISVNGVNGDNHKYSSVNLCNNTYSSANNGNNKS